jgi:DNA polymerase I-like protein with 3'-5' exonuclease and polymerase domains
MTASPLADVELHLVESVADAVDFMSWLSQRHDGPLGLDTETGGLSAYRDPLRTIQIGDKKHGWVIPWQQWGGVALEAFRKYEGEYVAHNLPFDWQFITEHTGIELPWERLHDTLPLARLDDPTRSNGLKPLVKKLVDSTAADGQRELSDGMAANGWNWATVPMDFPPYWIYAALDPCETVHLYDHLAPRIQTTCPEAYSLERATNRLCTKMMRKGMLLDVPYVEKSIADFDTKSDQIRAWLKSAHKITSPKSSGQIAKAMEGAGQETLFWTDRGAPKFDKDALQFYADHGENTAVRQLAQYIRAVRHIEDIRDRYSAKFLELRDAHDIVHCTINPMGARTGRMSVSDPALQQLPRDDKVIRGSFIPRPGHVFISCDLDQVEMRILAHLSRDPGLIEAFLEADSGGADFFTAVARVLYHNDQLVKSDPRRQLVKNSSYARAYGGGTEKLAMTAGVSVSEIKVFEDLFDQRFPGMRTLMDTLERDAKGAFRRGERGGVRLEDGRFLPCDKGKEYTNLNYDIQGTAAIIMKRLLGNIDAAGLGDALVLAVHDEAILEVPIAQAEEARRVVEDCMTDRQNYLVPLTAGGTILTERWQKA